MNLSLIRAGSSCKGETINGYVLARWDSPNILQPAIIAWPEGFEIRRQGSALSEPETHFVEYGRRGYLYGEPFNPPPAPPAVAIDPGPRDPRGFGQAQIPNTDRNAPDTAPSPPAPAPAVTQDKSTNTADINTWGTWQNERAITRIAPCSADGAHVALTLMPAWNIGGYALGEWFDVQTGSLVSGWSGSRVALHLPQLVDGDSLTAMHQFTDGAGNTWAVWFRAVQRGNRAQMAAVVAPAGIGNADPRVNTAYNFVRNQYAGGYTLTPEQTQVPIRPALDYNPSGAKVVGALRVSGIQIIGNGAIGTPDVYVLLDNGRAFLTTGGESSQSSSQATWRQTATGFELDWPQLQRRETVPASCFSAAPPATVARLPDAPARPAKKVCPKIPMTTNYIGGGSMTVWVEVDCN